MTNSSTQFTDYSNLPLRISLELTIYHESMCTDKTVNAIWEELFDCWHLIYQYRLEEAADYAGMHVMRYLESRDLMRQLEHIVNRVIVEVGA